MHDWSDERASVILRHLRDAASAVASPRKTRLLVIDRIVPYACRSTSDDDEAKDRDIPGLIKAEGVPEFLLPNLGAWGPTPYHADLNVRRPTCSCIPN